MITLNKFLLITGLFFLLSFTVFASAPNDKDPYWKCVAYDSEMKEWTAQASYERIAATNALDNCKKQSQNPSTCKLDRRYCMASTSVETPHTLWRCTAVDQMAKPWVGKPTVGGEAAALAAKAYCIQNSALPETCFINLLACKEVEAESK